METINLKLSRKQNEALSILNDPQVVDIDFGGASGGSKSWTVCLWMLLECINYPGIRIGLGRKELTRLKQTTVVTMLREVHPIMGVAKHEFVYNDHKATITYGNGSQIQLVDLAYQPSDPDYDTLGSLNLTHAVIEEAGEIAKKARDIFTSRKSTFLNNKYGIVGKSVLTQNPSQNFTRDEYYEPYMAKGGGSYRKWAIGKVEVNGRMLTAYRAFIKALPTDNPFLPRNRLEELRRLPPQQRKRLYEGNWDYMDEEDQLFPSTLFDRSLIGEIEPVDNPLKFIGVDVADKGKDKTIATLMENGIITKQKHLEIDKTQEAALSNLYALELIKFAQMEGFQPAEAKRIAVEGNGVGVGMRDFMRHRGWFITEYTATSQSRSQAYYNLSKHMDSGKTRIASNLENLSTIRKQLSIHTYEFDDKLQPKVLPKSKVKEVLGHSPDEADSVVIVDWVANQKMTTSRIVL